MVSPRMAVGIAGDADLDDAAGLQQAALDHFDRGMEGTGRRREIAADDEDAPDAGVFGEPGEMGVERGAAREAAHREMRDRLEARRGEPAGDVDLRCERPRRHRADIDARARRKAAQARRDRRGTRRVTSKEACAEKAAMRCCGSARRRGGVGAGASGHGCL